MFYSTQAHKVYLDFNGRPVSAVNDIAQSKVKLLLESYLNNAFPALKRESERSIMEFHAHISIAVK